MKAGKGDFAKALAGDFKMIDACMIS